MFDIERVEYGNVFNNFETKDFEIANPFKGLQFFFPYDLKRVKLVAFSKV